MREKSMTTKEILGNKVTKTFTYDTPVPVPVRQKIVWPIIKKRLILLGIGVAATVVLSMLGIERESALGFLTFIPMILIIVAIIGVTSECFEAASKRDKKNWDDVSLYLWRNDVNTQIVDYINSFGYKGFPYNRDNIQSPIVDVNDMERTIQHSYYDRFVNTNVQNPHGGTGGSGSRVYVRNMVTGEYVDTKTFFCFDLTFVDANNIQVTSYIMLDKD